MTRPSSAVSTCSNAGKSLLVTGLCRAFARRGLRVRPFKPQNMSNNAAVTADGGEIGRAQALQARACGIEPLTDMNPVLLKPQSEAGAQLVIQGRVAGSIAARDYRRQAPLLLPRVLESFTRLAESADLVLIEGAGSFMCEHARNHQGGNGHRQGDDSGRQQSRDIRVIRQASGEQMVHRLEGET